MFQPCKSSRMWRTDGRDIACLKKVGKEERGKNMFCSRLQSKDECVKEYDEFLRRTKKKEGEEVIRVIAWSCDCG